MIIECTECGAKYKYPDEKFGSEKVKKVKCTKCQQTFEIINPFLNGDENSQPSRTRKIEHSTGVSGSRAAQIGMLRLPPDKKLSIAVLEGTDSGQIFKIEKPSVLIGRADADMILNDSESSRQHALLEVRGDLVTLKDLGSTNGTFMDGEKITEKELENQDEFHIGSSTLMLIVTED